MKDGHGPLSLEIPKNCRIFEFHKNNFLTVIVPFIRYLRKERPSLVIANLTPANLLAVIGGKLSFIKTKISVGIQVAVGIQISTSFFKSKIRPWVYKLFFYFTDYIVAVSEGIKSDLLSFGVEKSKIKVIYNPVYSLDIIKRGDEKIKNKWFEDKNIKIILAVGRLHKQKDFPVLIKSFYNILNINKINAKLLILGEGPERNNLESLIDELNLKESVCLCGFVNNPYAYMNKSSIFVLSSAWEGFGNVVAEAMAFGLPIVSTDCPWGPSEILGNGKYGSLVPVGDYKLMTEAIIKELNSKRDKDFIIEGAKRFRSDVIFKEYYKLVD